MNLEMNLEGLGTQGSICLSLPSAMVKVLLPQLAPSQPQTLPLKGAL